MIEKAVDRLAGAGDVDFDPPLLILRYEGWDARRGRRVSVSTVVRGRLVL
jgi:hypothetical protein